MSFERATEPLRPDHVYPKLSGNQAKFVEEYVNCWNGTEAARRAGYSKNCAGTIASKLMNNPNVAEAITLTRKQIAARNGITADMVIQEIASVAFAHIGMFCTWDNGDMTLLSKEEILADPTKHRFLSSIAEVTVVENKNGRQVRIKMHDKMNALEKLGKVLDLFAPDEVNVNLNNMPELADKTSSLLSRLSRLAAAQPTGGNFIEHDSRGTVPSGEQLEILGPGQSTTPGG